MLHLLADYARDIGLTAEPGFTAKEIRWNLLFKKDGTFSEVVDLSGGEKKSKGLLFSKCPSLSQGELIGGPSERSQALYESAQTIALMFKADDNDKVKGRVRRKHTFFVSSLADCAKQAMPELANIATTLADENSCAQIEAVLKAKKAKPTDTVTIAVDFVRPLDLSTWHDWWRNFRKTLSEKPAEKQKNEAGIAQPLMLDLITGKQTTPCRTHPKISGLTDVGGQSFGDPLVSFDKEAFSSFNLRQGENATISEESATIYQQALNHLIRNHSRNLGKSKVVYWYKGKVTFSSDPIGLLYPQSQKKCDAEDALDFEGDNIDKQQNEAIALANARELLKSLQSGKLRDLTDTAYYSMIVSVDSGRVMIRDWTEGQFGHLAHNIVDWFEDFEIVARDGCNMASSPKFMAVMFSTVTGKTVAEKIKNLNAPFVTSMWRAALGGHNAPIPQSALAAAYARFKIDLISIDPKTNKPKAFNHARMGLIKAYHLRKNGGVKVTQELNELSDNVPYQCGRLMAILAEIQRRALGDVGAGVIQRFYAAASTTPALVFGKLINNSNAHLGKLQDRLSYIYTGKLAEVMSSIHGRIPKTLSLEEQTLFAMGYYQQIAFTRKQIADAASQKDQTKQPNSETDSQNT